MSPGEGSAPGDRRKHPRVSAEWPVTIRLAEGAHEARLRDVSKAGVCFYLDRRIPEMTVLETRFELPGQEGEPACSVEGRGVVVRCRPLSRHVDHYEIAVFFNELSGESLSHLSRYLPSP